MAIQKLILNTDLHVYGFLNEVTGHDDNDGLTPETAVLSMNRLCDVLQTATVPTGKQRYAVIEKNIIIDESIAVARTVGIMWDFRGGTIDGSGEITPHFGNQNNDVYVNGKAINYTSQFALRVNNSAFNIYNFHILQSTGFFVGHSTSTSAQRLTININNCVIDSVRMGNRVNINVFNSVLLNNVINPSSARDSLVASNNIFINCNAGWNYSNILKFNFNAIIGTYNNLTQAQLVELGLNLNGFEAPLEEDELDPQPYTAINFNSTANGVYTVNNRSICLYAGENGSHIGIGEGFYLNATDLLTDAIESSNLEIVNHKLVRINELYDSKLVTKIFDMGQVRTIDLVNLYANMLSNSVQNSSLINSLTIDAEGRVAWDSSVQYMEGSQVTDSNILYKAILNADNINKIPASQPTYWERITYFDAVHSAGKIIEYRADSWDIATEYSSGYVEHISDDRVRLFKFVGLTPDTGTEPGTDATVWEVVSFFWKAKQETSATWAEAEWEQVVPVCTQVYGIKYSATQSTLSDWSGDFQRQNFNRDFTVDVNGYGQANKEFDTINNSRVRLRYFQLEIGFKTVR